MPVLLDRCEGLLLGVDVLETGRVGRADVVCCELFARLIRRVRVVALLDLLQQPLEVGLALLQLGEHGGLGSWLRGRHWHRRLRLGFGWGLGGGGGVLDRGGLRLSGGVLFLVHESTSPWSLSFS